MGLDIGLPVGIEDIAYPPWPLTQSVDMLDGIKRIGKGFAVQVWLIF